ncbi:MAG TPA: hypothetical protein VGA36_04210, partial [Nitriliruptorales bacterium]
TVSHEVARLVEAGLLRRRREGNRSLIRAATDTSVSDEIRSLLTKTYGPVAELRSTFERLPVSYVAVYGSYAARWHGEPGPPPNDIDVLVVGDLDYETLWDATARLSRRLGIEVNAVLRDPAAWADDDTPFSHAIKQGPVVEIIGEAP